VVSTASRLIAILRPGLAREVIAAQRPDLLAAMHAHGDETRALAASLGIVAPAALVELADAMREVFIHVSSRSRGRDLVTPSEARQVLDFLLRLAERFPELLARSRMLPVFGQDGDYELLGQDGRIHGFTHDDWERDGVVAPSFDALLDGILAETSSAATAVTGGDDGGCQPG
jgi:hypothetical protein